MPGIQELSGENTCTYASRVAGRYVNFGRNLGLKASYNEQIPYYFLAISRPNANVSVDLRFGGSGA